MDFIKILDSFSVSFAWFIVCIILCKFFSHKKFTHIFAAVLLPAFFLCHYITHRYDSVAGLSYSRIVMQQLLVVAMFLLFGLYVFLCFNLSIGEKIAIFGMHIATTLTSEIFLSYLMISSIPDAQTLWDAPPKIRIIVDVLYLLINFILSLAVLSLFKKYIVRLPWKITLMVLIIGINVIALFMLAVSPAAIESGSKVYIYNTTFALVCATLLVVFIFLIVKYMIAQEHKNEEFTWIKNMQNIKIEHYSDIQNQIKEQRKIQHDYKENISILKVLVDSGDEKKIQKASELMSSLLDKAQSAKIVTYTNNEIANAVLSSKIKEANEKNIKVEAQIELPEEIGSIDDYDLNLLFINLLTNAIEACQNDKVDDKIIRISTAIRANLLIIKVANTYNSLNFDNKGKLITSKKDKKNHGIGLQIIDSIAKKYNGIDKIDPQEKEFIHTVTLNLNSPAKAK